MQGGSHGNTKDTVRENQLSHVSGPHTVGIGRFGWQPGSRRVPLELLLKTPRKGGTRDASLNPSGRIAYLAALCVWRPEILRKLPPDFRILLAVRPDFRWSGSLRAACFGPSI